jgi:hypothetical protein
MGLDITVLVADRSWLARVPARGRIARLRDAWYDDGTGLWDPEAPVDGKGWVRPGGPDGARFAVYEFAHTLGSFKAHFWAGERWEHVRDHVDPLLRDAVDEVLGGLVRDGPDGEARHTDTAFFGPDARGVLLALAPEGVRRLAAAWGRALPHLDRMRGPFAAHAAAPGGWVGDFDAFADLLGQWGHVLTEAARRGWCVVGLSE